MTAIKSAEAALGDLACNLGSTILPPGDSVRIQLIESWGEAFTHLEAVSYLKRSEQEMHMGVFPYISSSLWYRSFSRSVWNFWWECELHNLQYAYQ